MKTVLAQVISSCAFIKPKKLCNTCMSIFLTVGPIQWFVFLLLKSSMVTTDRRLSWLDQWLDQWRISGWISGWSVAGSVAGSGWHQPGFCSHQSSHLAQSTLAIGIILTYRGSIIKRLTSCFTCLDSIALLILNNKIFNCLGESNPSKW